MAKRPALAVRFWSKVQMLGPDDCWELQGSRKDGGFNYGHFSMPGNKIVRAHRMAWELTNGEIPRGLCVLHRCDNPPCCNPAHLFVGTVRENSIDMVMKGRDHGSVMALRAPRFEPWWVEYERRQKSHRGRV